jgi:hypothetical protein
MADEINVTKIIRFLKRALVRATFVPLFSLIQLWEANQLVCYRTFFLRGTVDA